MKLHLPLLPLLTGLATSAPAATRVWDGGDATANWSVSSNWNPNATIAAGDGIVFPPGLAAGDKVTNHNYAAGTSWDGITFNDSGYTLNGNQIRLTDRLLTAAAGTVTVNADLILDESLFLGADNGGTLNLSVVCSVDLNNHFGGFFAGTAASTVLVQGPVTGAYAGNLNFTGPGKIELRGAKTFTANPAILNGAEVVFTNKDSFGAAGNIIRLVEGTLLGAQPQPDGMEVPQALQISNGAGDSAIVRSTAGSVSFEGPVTLSGPGVKEFDAQVNDITLAGHLTSSGGQIVKAGPGALTVISGGVDGVISGPGMLIKEGSVYLINLPARRAMGGDVLNIGNSSSDIADAELHILNSEQVDNATLIRVNSDGALILAGAANEVVGALSLEAPGRITTGTGELIVSDTLIPIASPGGSKVFTFEGNLRVNTGTQTWMAGNNDGNELNDAGLHLDGVINGGEARTFVKDGEGDLTLYGNHTIGRLRIKGGLNIVRGNSPNTDIEAGGNFFLSSGSMRHLTVTSPAFVPTAQNGGINGIVDCVNLNFLPGGKYSCTFGALVPEAGETHDQIRASGTVDLTGGELVPYPYDSPQETIVPGDEIIIIMKSGAEPVTGIFNGLPEGAFITADGRSFRISYQGGDGNDVSLTCMVQPTGVTRLWDGGGTDDNWMTANNWNPNGQPQPGDDLVFPTLAQRKDNVNNYPAGTTFNSITVHGTNYNIAGNRITLNQKLEFTSLNGSPTWSAPLSLAQDVTVSITGDTFLQCSGDVDAHGHDLILHNGANANGNIYLSGTVSGTGGVRKTGPGRATLFDTPHTYAGPTSIEAGTLALSYQATLGSPAGGTTVAQGAILQFRNNEDPISSGESITLYGHLADNGGTFPARINGPVLAAAESAAIESSGDQMVINGSISGTSLKKLGTGTITLAGIVPNTLSGELVIFAGEVRLQKAFGNALPGGALVGIADTAGRLTLAAPNQIADTALVQIRHPDSVFDIGGFSETLAAVTMQSGRVAGTSAGRLTVSGLLIYPHASTAFISAPVVAGIPFCPVAVTYGGSTPGLRVEAPLYGESFQKQGDGRMDLTAGIPSEGADKFMITQGSVLVFANCRYTNIELNGGTIGGQGTVGNIAALPGGSVSPGTDSAAAGLGGYASAWNATTVMRVQLNGLNPGGEYDQYAVFGPLSLGNCKLDLSAGFDAPANAEFMIVRNVSGQPVAGTFAGIPEGGYVSAPGAKVFRVTYQGGDGDDVVLTKVDVAAPQIESHEMKPGTGDEHKGDYETDMVVKGTPGLSYQIEFSTDLVSWTVGESKVADLQTGLMEFEFFNPETDPRLFLRVRLP